MIRGLESTDFSLFLLPQKDPSLKKVPLFAIIEKIEKLRRDPM